MLYSFFIFGTKSGLLLYEINFQNVTKDKIDMLGGFFSALKTFISKIMLEGKAELTSIGMQDYNIFTNTIPELNVDMVIIYDKDDYKKLQKLVPQLNKLLFEHKELFLDWVADRSEFYLLDTPIMEILKSNKVIPEFVVKTPRERVMYSDWDEKYDLAPEKSKMLLDEIDILTARLERVSQFDKKLAILAKIIENAEELQDSLFRLGAVNADAIANY